MNEDQDPMLGDETAQKEYQQKVMAAMYEAIQETRAARRMPASMKESDPVMLGATGFDGNLNSAT